MKEEIAKIIYGDAFEGDGLSFTNKNDLTMEQSREIADQILDLILSKIVIEKKEINNIKFIGSEHQQIEVQNDMGFNDCIDQLEALKAELRK